MASTSCANRFDFDIELVIKLVKKGYVPIELPVNYAARSFAEGKKGQFHARWPHLALDHSEASAVPNRTRGQCLHDGGPARFEPAPARAVPHTVAARSAPSCSRPAS